MLAQFIINGIVIGCAYTLVALGLTLMFGIMHIVNFAHGEIYMLGAFVTFFLTKALGGNFLLAIVLSMVVIYVLGMVLERLTFRPLYGKAHINMFLVSIGLVTFLQYGSSIVFGADSRTMETPYSGQSIRFLGLFITQERALVVIVTLVLIGCLYLLIQKTKIGRAMRAAAQNPIGAGMVGVDIKQVSSFAFAVGCALAAAAGSLLGPIFSISPFMGSMPVMKAFNVMILGGMGSVPGAILGGFLLGLTESLAGGYFLYEYKDAIGFVVLILVLSLRPAGLLGKKVN